MIPDANAWRSDTSRIAVLMLTVMVDKAHRAGLKYVHVTDDDLARAVNMVVEWERDLDKGGAILRAVPR